MGVRKATGALRRGRADPRVGPVDPAGPGADSRLYNSRRRDGRVVDGRPEDGRQPELLEDGRPAGGHRVGRTDRAKVGRRASARYTATRTGIPQVTAIGAGASA